MSIYRGPGGGGDATVDTELNTFISLSQAAETSAQNAAVSEAAAAASEVAAAVSEANAAASESAASSSASAAASSASSAAASYDSFDDRYLGPKSSAPTLDNDGNALLEGALYWDTTEKAMYVYNGTSWIILTGGSVTQQSFTGDGVTDTFTLASTPLSENNTQVYIDGVYQNKATYSVLGSFLTFSEAPPAPASGTGNIEVIQISSLPIGSTTADLVSYTPVGTGAVATNVQSRLREYEADGGADLIGFLPSGTGATERAVGDKLREWVSAADYASETDAASAAQNNTADFYVSETSFIAGGDTVATFGSELVTNGSFNGSATGWTLGANWAYGSNNVVFTNSGGGGTLSQTINVENGKYYLITWSQTNSVENNALVQPDIGTVYVGNPVIRANSTGAFTQSQVIIADTTGPTTLKFTVTPITSTGTITIDDVSVKEVIQYPAMLDFRSEVADQYPMEIRSTGVGSALSNMYFGDQVGAMNTSGASNTAFGWRAMLYNTTGYENTAYGVAALRFNTTGYRNTAVGLTALRCNSSGFQNTAIGYEAGFDNSSGFSNTAVGHQALTNNNAGTNNTAVGTFALLNNTTGAFNTAVGVNAGRYAGSSTSVNATPNTCTYIGYNSRAYEFVGGTTNEIVIGHNSVGAGSNTTTIGNSSTLETVIPAGTIRSIGTYNYTTAISTNVFVDSGGLLGRSTSSIRFKTDIEPLEHARADAVIFGARPVWYRSTCERDPSAWGFYGLIAEELADIDPRLVHWGRPTKTVLVIEAQPEVPAKDAVFDEVGNVIEQAVEYQPAVAAQYAEVEDTDAPMRPDGVQYDRLTILLIDVVQRQKKQLDELEARIAELELKCSV